MCVRVCVRERERGGTSFNNKVFRILAPFLEEKGNYKDMSEVIVLKRARQKH